MVQILSEGHNTGTALMGRAPQLKLVGHICASDPVVIGAGLL